MVASGQVSYSFPAHEGVYKMATHFNQSDIDEFRDCVGFLCSEGKAKVISNLNELTLVMRSLGFSPTKEELENYYEKYSKDGRIDFATFLEIMHQHSQNEKCQQEIMAAFQSQDTLGRGTVNAADLIHTLTNFGERLSRQEVERLFKEAGIAQRGEVPYPQVVQAVLTPMADY